MITDICILNKTENVMITDTCILNKSENVMKADTCILNKTGHTTHHSSSKIGYSF